MQRRRFYKMKILFTSNAICLGIKKILLKTKNRKLLKLGVGDEYQKFRRRKEGQTKRYRYLKMNTHGFIQKAIMER